MEKRDLIDTVMDGLRLSGISRWAIIDVYREQSVAEHSYNVMWIAQYFCEVVFVDRVESEQATLSNMAMRWALMHDLGEVYTGDIPATFKNKIREEAEVYEDDHVPEVGLTRKMIPREVLAIVKVADVMEAILYCKEFVADHDKEKVLEFLHKDLAARFSEAKEVLSHEEYMRIVQCVSELSVKRRELK